MRLTGCYKPSIRLSSLILSLSLLLSLSPLSLYLSFSFSLSISTTPSSLSLLSLSPSLSPLSLPLSLSQRPRGKLDGRVSKYSQPHFRSRSPTDPAADSEERPEIRFATPALPGVRLAPPQNLVALQRAGAEPHAVARPADHGGP